MAMTSDMNRGIMYAMPRGLSILPSMPLRKNMGINATMTINVAFRIDERISLEPSNTTLKTGCRNDGDN